ncbi:uncharacterized protein METZ01_LOCUS181931, partial [marine metagenome]
MMKNKIGLTVLFSIVVCPLIVLASDQVPAPPQDHPIALVGGTIHTVSGQTI